MSTDKQPQATTRRLIVNADDFGRTSEINAGIRQAHRQGIVTSTTVMINFPSAAEAVGRAVAECPALGIGVHLCLTAGRPVLPPSQVSSLVGTDNAFHPRRAQQSRLEKLAPSEVRAELRAQIEATLASGALVDHLDSHHHATYLHPMLFAILLELADEYRLPIRWPLSASKTTTVSNVTSNQLELETRRRISHAISTVGLTANLARPDTFIDSFYDTGATLEGMLRIIEELPAGISEIMCHPGYTHAETPSSYNTQRERELGVLCHPAVQQALINRRIELVSFRSLHTESL